MTNSFSIFKPHKYQSEAIKWLCSKPEVGLFLPPGLGKTAISLYAFDVLQRANKIDKLFIIAPIRPIYLVWPNEISKWAQFNGIKYAILHGKDKEKALLEDADVYLINPEGLKWFSRHVTKLFSTGKWALLVDESSNFKNSRSKRFKLLKKWLNYFERRSILTGTPAPNGLENIWSQLFILDGGHRLGKFITAYRNKYFYPSGYMGYEHELQPGADKLIYEKIDDIVMHKSRDEINMPDLLRNIIQVKLPSPATKVYKDMAREYLAIADKEVITAVNAAVMSGKLKQISNGAVYSEDGSTAIVHDAKIDAIQELLDSLEGQPLLVFYEFKHDLNRLKKTFSAPNLGGGVKPKDASEIVQKWNAGEIPILLLHPKSAGHGLNLQAGGCHDVCWFSITWDQELHEQAISRVWRQGIDSAVTSHYIVAKSTIDEYIMTILDGKADLQNALLEAIKK